MFTYLLTYLLAFSMRPSTSNVGSRRTQWETENATYYVFRRI